MEISGIWFSHYEKKYEEITDGKKYIKWLEPTKELPRWDWDNCSLLCIKLEQNNNLVKIVIRSSKMQHSRFHKKNVRLKYMLGFDIDVGNLKCPTEDEFQVNKNNKTQEKGPPKTRWVLHLDKDHCVWQWKEEELNIKNSKVWKIYEEISKKNLERPLPSDIFGLDLKRNSKDDDADIMPVIYQPAIDSWKNFLRQVDCFKINSQEYQITLSFEGEQLRKHWLVEPVYKLYRIIVYGRTFDVETFNIVLEKGTPAFYNFSAYGDKPIYSEDNVENEDSIHEPMPKMPIKYFFVNKKHPIIFINTANHAMAEHDNNHKLWKWEYIPWDTDCAVKIDHRSRKEIEELKKTYSSEFGIKTSQYKQL